MIRTGRILVLLALAFLAGMGVQAAVQPTAAAIKPRPITVDCSPAAVTPLPTTEVIVLTIPVRTPPPTATGTPPTALPVPTYPTLIATPLPPVFSK